MQRPYESLTPRSAAAFEKAGERIAGGVSRQTLKFEPYPFYAAHGRGCELVDTDGNRYLDLVNNYTSLIHGHAHGPSVMAMVTSIREGHALGCPTEDEYRLAGVLCERFPSIESLRFTTTGSEAMILAARAARAATRRSRVLKFEGGFHGMGDEFFVAVRPSRPLGSGEFRVAEPHSDGLSEVGTIVARYNDIDSVQEALRAFGHEIAAIVVEPFLGNAALIEALPGFLSSLSSLTSANGSMLILDEIQSTRLDYGGAQTLHGVKPDLMTSGKIIGGGMPLAVVGGRAEAMFGFIGTRPSIAQTGTFTGFGVAVRAGLAALEHWQPVDIERLNALGAIMRTEIKRVFEAHDLPIRVNGSGSMFSIVISDRAINYVSDLDDADQKMWQLLFLELLAQGVYVLPRGTGCLSTPMDRSHVEEFIDKLDRALAASLKSQAPAQAAR